jgi:sucrose phosphorylase
VPQIYYVGLLAGENDGQAVLDSEEGRAINRQNYTFAEVEAAVRRPVVRRVLDLIRLRNAEPAFAGRMVASTRDDSSLRMTWLHHEASCELEVDLVMGRASITSRRDGYERRITP